MRQRSWVTGSWATDGAQGVPGPKGADGKTPYLHIAYATNATGTAGFSTTDSAGKSYIGQYTDYTQADSTDPAKYSWTLIKGDKGDKGDKGERGSQLSEGLMLYTDPTFLQGKNGLMPYNNNSTNSSVKLERIARVSECPTKSTHMLRYTVVSGTPAPNSGGFFWGTPSRANAVFVARMVAKLPVGVKIEFHTNPIGNGAKNEMLSSSVGTGRYEEYIHRTICGTDGYFSTTLFYSFSGLKIGQSVDIASATVYDMTDVSDYYTQIAEVRSGVANANTLISTLQNALDKLNKGLLDKADIADVQYLLDSLSRGATQIAGGLLLTNDIILSSPRSGKVTAALSGSATEGHKALRLGIKDASTELTALRNDGTGHIGQLHFNDDRIVVAPIGDLANAFMEFGRNVMQQTIQEVINNGNYNNTASLGTVSISNGEQVKKTFNVPYDGTHVTISMTLKVHPHQGLPPTLAGPPSIQEGYNSKSIYAYLDEQETPFAQVGSIVDMQAGVGGVETYYYHPKSEMVSWTARLPKGEHTVCIRTNFGSGSAEYVRVQQVYSSNYRQTSFSDRGMRIYGGVNSLVDFNHDHPAGTTFAMIRGGLDVDYIKTPDGGFYAGGVITTYGEMFRWVGKKLTVLKMGTGRYKITHNLGHTNYVIQAIPVNSNDWNAFVISGTETTASVEIGVQWNGGWRNGGIHFCIFAK